MLSNRVEKPLEILSRRTAVLESSLKVSWETAGGLRERGQVAQRLAKIGSGE
jgi:hypothetical protein